MWKDELIKKIEESEEIEEKIRLIKEIDESAKDEPIDG
jgi:hypothetical protein